MANRQPDELEWDYEEADLKKGQSVLEIVRDAGSEKMSKASLTRLRKALKVLGFVANGPGQYAVEERLDYRSPQTHKLYKEFADLDKKK